MQQVTRTRRFRIAIVTSSRLSEIGGRETYIWELVKTLRNREHVMTVFSARERPRHANTPPALAVQNRRYDVAIEPGISQHILPCLFFQLIRNIGKVDVINAHEFGVLSSDTCLLVSIIFRKPLLLTVHNPILSDSFLFRHLFGAYCRTLGLLMVSKASKIIVASKWVHGRFLKIYPGFEEKFVYLPNAVGTDEIRPDFSKKPPHVLSMGRSVKCKNFEFVLKSIPMVAEIVPGLRVSIVGPTGRYARELGEVASQLGIGEHVRIIASIPRHMTVHFYSASKLFAHASTLDTIPTVVLESMAYGIPVVTTPVGDVEELVKSGSNGYIVNSPAEMGKCLLELLCREDVYHNMASAARRTAELYSWKELAMKYEVIIGDISKGSA